MLNGNSSLSPKELGYYWPAEWEPHEATWLSWPHNIKTWPGNFDPIPIVFEKLIEIISSYEPVHLLVRKKEFKEVSKKFTAKPNLSLHQIETNDCWIRDYGPWFLKHPDSKFKETLISWEYNSWGEKYPPFEEDNAVPASIANINDFHLFASELVIEGGAVENNGDGVLLVTSQCLLNPNRNPSHSRKEIETSLCQYTGAEKVIWLFDSDQSSLAGDDTDAHIDQMARFASPERIIVSEEKKESSPNFWLLRSLKEQLSHETNQHGDPFEIIDLPMPSALFFEQQQLPASYANFYLGNGFVIVPTFNCSEDKIALEILAEQFPTREVIGLDATDFVWGLGAFHCATMQQPKRE